MKKNQKFKVEFFMFREKRLILILLFIFTGINVFTPPVLSDTPESCAFYGEVTLFGEPAPIGSTIMATINGQERGRITTKETGHYGSTCIFGEHLIVQPTEEDYIHEEILLIDFFVDGLKTDQTSFFHPGTIRWVDLTVAKKPSPVPTTTATPSPEVMFNTTPRTGYAPLNVSFTDLTLSGAESWIWDFGDDTHSNLQHPNHLYRYPGNYSVNLSIRNESGISWLRIQDCVKAEQVPMMPFPNQTGQPTDPDNDGFYEDLNGNQEIDFNDLYIFFKSMNWIEGNIPINPFDFNLNGCVDLQDLFMLFRDI